MENIVVHYKDFIEMNGKGITKVVYNGEEISLDDFVSNVYEEIRATIPEVVDMSMYIGSSSVFTYDILFDYDPNEVPDTIVDAVNDYVDNNFKIVFEKEESIAASIEKVYRRDRETLIKRGSKPLDNELDDFFAWCDANKVVAYKKEAAMYPEALGNMFGKVKIAIINLEVSIQHDPTIEVLRASVKKTVEGLRNSIKESEDIIKGV